MKYWLPIICLASITFYCQAETKLSSTIKEVTVYNDQAAVTRHAQIQLGAGEHELVFENLPNGFDNNSLQLDVKATNPVTILDINVKPHYLVGNANKRLQLIEKEKEEIKEDLSLISAQMAFLKEQRNLVDHTQEIMAGGVEGANRPTLEQVKQVLELTNSSLVQLSEDSYQLAVKKDVLRRKLEVLENSRVPLLQKARSQVKDVMVKVTVPHAETVNFNLTYIVRGAQWSPIYDVRFNSKDQKLSLGYLATISQQTGEDWQNVKLSLSTAEPSLGGSVPSLSTWRVRPGEYPTSLPYMEATAEQYNRAARSLVAAPKGLLTSLTNTTFAISEEVTLLSENSEQKVMIHSLEDLPSDLVYQTVPRLREIALLQAVTKNNSNYPLIAGQLNVFMDGRFITTGNLKSTMPNEALKISLGADEALKVTYKKLKQFTEKTGFTKSGERITYDYLITVQNNKNKEVKLAIADHIPVSQNEKIKVKLLSPTHIQPDNEGRVNWDITLKPMEKLEIPIKFTVDYPVDTKVIGL